MVRRTWLEVLGLSLVALAGFGVMSAQAATIAEVEPNNTAITAILHNNSMAFYDDFTGEINPGLDSDIVAFAATGGETIVARTVLGSLHDSILILLDTDGLTGLAFDDDSGGGLASRIEFTLPPVAGTYYLLVHSFGHVYSGTYTLQLRRHASCPTTCMVTDKQTLRGLTVEGPISCALTLGNYCAGGDAHRGIAPDPNHILAPCGLSFVATNETNSQALDGLDHHYLQSTITPKVVDMGSAVNTVFVFPAVDHGPFPEEGIESSVWASGSCDLSNFPSGWVLGTLTKIYAEGWVENGCAIGDEADDFVGQYSFIGGVFRYIAIHANYSVTIFDDPSHTTWSAEADDSDLPGWQSYDDEIDAVGTPLCRPGGVVAVINPDQAVGLLGELTCFDAVNSTGNALTFAWDLDSDGVIDATGPTACILCVACTQPVTVTLYVTDTCGCVASDQVTFRCCDTPVLSTGGRRRSCPPDIAVTCTSPNGISVADVSLVAMVIDDCDPNVQITDDRPADFFPPSCDDDQPTVVTFTALNNCGLTDTCETRVFVYGAMCCPGQVDTGLTLMPADLDLRQDTNGPVNTKAKFDVWNQNEVRFSGTERCISCWDQTLMSSYDSPNHLLKHNLQTDKGRARIDGLGSTVCPESVSSPLLGVAKRSIRFRGGPPPRPLFGPRPLPDTILGSAITLPGTGSQSARILFDVISPPGDALSNAAVGGLRIESSATPTPLGAGPSLGDRGSISTKGSVFYLPLVQVRWDESGKLFEDTFVSVVNDGDQDVSVQFYFVNGDGPLDAMYVGDPQRLLERAHEGWNNVDNNFVLTSNQSTYWSAVTGAPQGVSPWQILDPGYPPGRPDLNPDNRGGRMIRGMIIGWAVDAQGREINWNHLTATATLVDYRDSSASEYSSWSFACVSGSAPGAWCDATPGELDLNGLEYASAPDKLLLDFYSVGSSALSHPGLNR